MQTCSQDIVLVLCGGEYGAVGPECLTGSVDIGGAYALNAGDGLTAGVLLTIYLTVAEYLGYHLGGQGVYARYTYAVQTA